MKGSFLTGSAKIQQLDKKGMYRLCANELYKDEDGTIYLAWRNFQTDNFTWINSNDWDTRCSHINDIGCKYHQIVKVNLNETKLKEKGILQISPYSSNELICNDIPKEYLEVIKASGHKINNMFYRMLKAADCPKTPKFIQILYRCGVALNFKWFISGKKKINLEKIYNRKWNEK